MTPYELKLKNITSIEGREHFPRPDYIRIPSWSLNGEWVLVPDRKNKGKRLQWYSKSNVQKILHNWYNIDEFESYPVVVPFPLEAPVNAPFHDQSGIVPEKVITQKRYWYFCSFEIQGIKSGILNFGACDYRTTVWLNGKFLGTHEGGYTPFSFFVSDFEENNYLAVLVEDSLSPSQIRGKQTFVRKPFMVWYTNITGIWQDVWIEKVGTSYIHSVICKRYNQTAQFHISVETSDNTANDYKIEFMIYASQVYKKKSGLQTPIKVYKDIVIFDVFKKGELVFEVPQTLFELWSPGHPSLHPIKIVLKKGTKEIDTIYTYYGRRDIEIKNGTIQLNKKNIYQRLLLNQGYYPEGLYRPADITRYKTDIESMKAMGFNGCRIHQKIEDPRFLYWADCVGFLVWEEMPSYYLPCKNNMERLRDQFQEMLKRDCMHPSIITLVLYNESWGLYSMFFLKRVRDALARLYEWVKTEYPGYCVIDNSGFHHVKCDIADIHHYLTHFDDIEEFYRRLVNGVREAPLWANFIAMIMGKENVQTPYLKGYGDTAAPLLISELGGFGFGMYHSEANTLEEAFQKHCTILAKFHQIQGFCYTQFTDTFQETNGIFTFDRTPKAKLLPIMQKALSKHIFW